MFVADVKCSIMRCSHCLGLVLRAVTRATQWRLTVPPCRLSAVLLVDTVGQINDDYINTALNIECSVKLFLLYSFQRNSRSYICKSQTQKFTSPAVIATFFTLGPPQCELRPHNSRSDPGNRGDSAGSRATRCFTIA